ncbi:heat-shock protein [Actinorhabdospora filicis]|uniref:Heat-shock protein n=1 Tax=Actinorhabdospora filicis TaxID=1785913 RepID=A0A9W6SHS2_9ACTN|nr:ATP-binding protein [Actinorhabdospora filicis]GLZ75699.1 heat-shock protein [Actinorhabdospora filicis]
MREELRQTEVDLGGLVSVLAAHLYSTPMVALRELVQNGHDSATRRRLEDPAAPTGRIIVRGDADTTKTGAATVSVTDEGAGLTEDEIHSYLATVGTGYTRLLRDVTGSEDLIGAFGLGFLSAFAVADEVTVHTTSHREPGRGHRYHSVGGETYAVTEAPARAPGTEVTLRLKPDYAHLADTQTLREVLTRYCALLPIPVHVEDDATPVNDVPPPWRDGGAEPMVFAARFAQRLAPLCAIPVHLDGDTEATGLLWIQDAATYGSSDNRDLSVCLRGMMLSHDARDLLPTWAGFIGGVIESTRLTPTASREDLQRDDRYRDVQKGLTEAIVNGMFEIARTQPGTWQRVLNRHGNELLGAALADDRLFDLLADDVPVPTSSGDRLTAGALRAAGNGTIHIATGDSGGFTEMLYRAMQVPIARGDHYAVLPFLRRYAVARSCPTIELGTGDGDKRLFKDAEPLPTAEQDWLTAVLTDDGEQLVPARYAPAALPLVLVPDAEVALKRRIEADETAARIPSAALALARDFTAKTDGTVAARLYLNLDNIAVRRLLQAHRDDHPGRTTAAALLRSIKVIMAATAGDHRGDLSAALVGVGSAIERLVTGDGA